ncbi:MAG: glycosyltransferase [Anaerolineae bacterium]|nr:glycosyltransferase [Anaerolineae bacterium]
MPNELISIVLPVYNQADHIGGVIDAYEPALARMSLPYEILLVVNGSRDNSLEVCRRIAETDPSLRVLHTDQGGWGRAVKQGVAEARGEIICYTNSARTTAQQLVLLLLYAVANPGNVIKANRKVRENWQRRIGSLLYNIECRTLFDLAYWDINGTPKVFPRSFSKLIALTSDDDLIDLEFNVICRRENYPMLEVPIYSTRRHGGKSTTRYKSAFGMYVGAYRLWQRFRQEDHER